jgi:hypothetical protein
MLHLFMEQSEDFGEPFRLSKNGTTSHPNLLNRGLIEEKARSSSHRKNGGYCTVIKHQIRNFTHE